MTYSAAFLAFWQAYACPRRVKKLAAYAAWCKGGCEGNYADIMAGLERFKLTAQWSDGFMPEAERFLKHRRWEDEPTEQVGGSPSADGWDVTGPPTREG